MPASPLALLLPFVISLLIPLGLRFGLGAERAQRFGSIGAPLVFLISWGVIVRPGWLAYDPLGRIGHIVVGGMLLGLLLDTFIQRRVLVIAAAAIYIAVCAWMEAVGGVWPKQVTTGMFAAFVVGAAVGGGLLWRIDLLRRSEQPYIASTTATLLQLTLMAASLALVAGVAEDVPLRAGAMILAAVIAGYLVFSAVFALELDNLMVLVLGGALFGIAWALVERNHAAAPGVALSGLILFAEGTAQRVSLPKAGISRILYPLILAITALGPILLAALLTYAVRAT